MLRIGYRSGIVLGIGVAALLVAAWVRLGRRSEPREAREVRRALAAGRYADARAALARWLKASPDAPEAHFFQGRAALALGNLPEAVEELKRAHALGLPRRELVLLQSLIASKVGRHAEAEPVLSRAFVESRGPDPQLDEALAKVYLETFNLARAGVVLDRWTRDAPDDPKPHLWRVEIDSRTGDGKAAVLKDYREALRRDPNLAQARLGLANELREAHRNAEAAVEYEAYLALKPDDPAAHLGAGRNLLEQGDEADATRHLERALALDPKNASVHKELAEADLRRGNFTAALGHLDSAIALDPHDLPLRHRHSLILTRLGRTVEAKAEQALSDRLRVELDQLSSARSRLLKSPHDRRSQVEVARWMFDHGHDREGVHWAEKILVEQPDDPDASRLLADYHQRQGNAGLANFYRLHAAPGPEPPPVGQGHSQ